MTTTGKFQAVLFDLDGTLVDTAPDLCGTIQDMQTKCTFRRITGAGMRESHVHDVMVTREPPNYRVNNN